MDVGTAKVLAADRLRVPHHGLDLVEPDEPFSAADFQRHALQALGGIAGRGHVALLVGGTGLYLRAVARGLPLGEGSADPQLRAAVEAELVERGLPALASELASLAPSVAVQTDLANPRRVTRALERARLAGDRLPGPPRGYDGPLLWLGLRVEPALHRGWIAARAAAQFASGLLEEAAALRRRYPADLRAFSAFGYREAMAVLDGHMDRDAALAETVRRTVGYAKRQRTWFRSEPDVEWLDARRLDVPALAERVGAFLESHGRPVDGPDR